MRILYMTYFLNLIVHLTLECQVSCYLQENDMEGNHPANYEVSSEDIGGIWKEGEVNWMEVNEFKETAWG